jgi:hypothetical protein
VVSEVIGLSFTPSREYSAFMRWNRTCSEGKSFGVTAGDTIMMGMRTYREMMPCPNGLPVDESTPATNPVWRARIEKAKRDRDRHRREIESQLIEWSFVEVQELVSIARGFDE